VPAVTLHENASCRRVPSCAWDVPLAQSPAAQALTAERD
jgi:hypothetical protein